MKRNLDNEICRVHKLFKSDVSLSVRVDQAMDKLNANHGPLLFDRMTRVQQEVALACHHHSNILDHANLITKTVGKTHYSLMLHLALAHRNLLICTC
jgi:hypothetical protein